MIFSYLSDCLRTVSDAATASERLLTLENELAEARALAVVSHRSHKACKVELERCQAELRKWRQTASTASPDALAAELGRLRPAHANAVEAAKDRERLQAEQARVLRALAAADGLQGLIIQGCLRSFCSSAPREHFAWHVDHFRIDITDTSFAQTRSSDG